MTVNWWLVTLAFVLGLVITLGFTVRRVETGDDSDTARVTDEPYGEGSVRLAMASADGPSGYPVKGNEDSMLYHSPESPTYERTIAEVWFRDVRTAEAAGFNRWDSGKSQRGK